MAPHQYRRILTPPKGSFFLYGVRGVGKSTWARQTFAHAHIVDPAAIDAGGRIVFGATVDLEDLETGDEVCYQIVGNEEADIKHGKISVESPIARALIGKSAGDIAEVQAPAGVREYEVLAVRYL